MAQRIIFVDDIDGSEGAETVQFGLDGVDYDIDLSPENAARLRDFLTEFVSHARSHAQPRKTAAAAGRSGTARKATAKATAKSPAKAAASKQRRPKAAAKSRSRKATSTANGTARSKDAAKTDSGDRVDPQQVRDWARANAVDVSPRGRIPGEVVDQFLAATA